MRWLPSREAMSISRYNDPGALRKAITDRLRPLALDRGIELTDLLRQFAYDRLLCRVFTGEPERWILKGATAMLARLEGCCPTDTQLSRQTSRMSHAR